MSEQQGKLLVSQALLALLLAGPLQTLSASVPRTTALLGTHFSAHPGCISMAGHGMLQSWDKGSAGSDESPSSELSSSQCACLDSL